MKVKNYASYRNDVALIFQIVYFLSFRACMMNGGALFEVPLHKEANGYSRIGLTWEKLKIFARNWGKVEKKRFVRKNR